MSVRLLLLPLCLACTGTDPQWPAESAVIAGQSQCVTVNAPIDRAPDTGVVVIPENVDTFGPEMSLGIPTVVKHCVGASSIGDWLDGGLLEQALDLVPPGFSVTAWYWVQGETDAVYGNLAFTYRANLEELLARVRAEFGPVPVIIAKIQSDRFQFSAIVRNAQQAVCNLDPLTECVDTDDLPLSDGLHFSWRGVVTLGERMAEAREGM